MRTMESEAVIRDSGPAADAAYDETIRIQDGRLCVALVRADYLVAELNGVHCVITKSALLCLGGCDRLEILYEKRLRVRALSFTPRFINRGLGLRHPLFPLVSRAGKRRSVIPRLTPFFPVPPFIMGFYRWRKSLTVCSIPILTSCSASCGTIPTGTGPAGPGLCCFRCSARPGSSTGSLAPRLSGFPDRGNDAVYPDASGPGPCRWRICVRVFM